MADKPFPSPRWKTHLPHIKPIHDILKDPRFNKGTSFTLEERNQLHLRGLLPPKVEALEEQTERCLTQLRAFETPIQKYIYIASLKERNITLFYSLLIQNLQELLPIVYTPTVGDACLQYGHNWRTAEGMYFCKQDRGLMREMLNNWPNSVEIIVVTDGSRILGLGDLGTNGMGIPSGKLSLYVAAGGFHPSSTLPVVLDFGTNNENYLKDPLYLGCKHHRIGNEEYYPLVDEFLMAVQNKWPEALVQFEDFSNDHCFDLLEKYRNKLLCFNDDIQGTGAVIAAGFINAVKFISTPLKDQKFVFFGAGSAGIGVAQAIVNVMEESGLSNLEARRRFWFVDSHGLVTSNRGDKLASFKVPFARDDEKEQYKDLLSVIKHVKPTGLIGLSGVARSFTEEIIKELAKHTENPIIFSLSNPTSKSECTAEQAYQWTDGKCIFASGSPFDPVEIKGKTYTPAQGNNMYIFPGLGFGAALAKATKVSDGMITAATKTLAECVSKEELAKRSIYPPLVEIRDISAKIAVAVMLRAKNEGLSQLTDWPSNLDEYVRDSMYQPVYVSLNEMN